MTHKWLRKIYVESKNRCVLRSKKPWSDPSPRAPAPRTGATHVDPLTQMPDISLGFPTPRLGDHHQRVPYIPWRWNIIPSRWFGWLEDDHFPYAKYGVMAVGDGCMWSSRENLPGCSVWEWMSSKLLEGLALRVSSPSVRGFFLGFFMDWDAMGFIIPSSTIWDNMFFTLIMFFSGWHSFKKLLVWLLGWFFWKIKSLRIELAGWGTYHTWRIIPVTKWLVPPHLQAM